MLTHAQTQDPSSNYTGQLIVVIGSDGGRATVSRAIATEASVVLRDLLDGQDLAISMEQDRQQQQQREQPHPSKPLHDLDSLFEDCGSPSPPVHLMDFTGAHSNPLQGASHMGTSAEAQQSQRRLPPLSEQIDCTVSQNCDTAQSSLAPDVIELSFPYFSGDILRRVCYHMSYRFRTSNFGVEDGKVRVFPNKMREIPKPMTLPLSEYLDSRDHAFLVDWDEEITIWMIKAATLLNYDELLQLASAKLASYLSEKSVEGVRTLLGVESDFTSQEEAELMKEQVVELSK